MKQSDFDPFHKLLNGCLNFWKNPANAETAAIWFRSLEEYPLDTVVLAFSGHMRDPVAGMYEPKPAHIIKQIARVMGSDGRPGPEEAWAISLAARDESDTVVWTAECAQAWGVSSPVMEMGDEVGARMAFKEAYNRLVLEARDRREPASWEVSEGFDKERRRIAIASAVDAGRINAGRHLEIDHSATLMIGLSGGGGIPAHIREKLSELRESWTAVYEGPSEAELEAVRIAGLKMEQQAKVEQFIRGER